MAKLLERADAINGSMAAISVAAHTYNTRVVPIVSYKARLIPLPPEAPIVERKVLHKVTKYATNAVRHADFFHLSEAGGPKLHSFSAAAAAAMFRTASKTLATWPQWLSQLKAASKEAGPIAQWICSNYSPSFWDSTPIASNLSDAFHGFPGDI